MFKPVLSGENSIIAGVATVALVAGIYQLTVGSVAEVHMTDAYHPATSTSVKKAGWTSLVTVAGITLLARDPNIGILGGAAIVAFHAHYRHANMTHPDTGQIVPPGPQAYQPAQYTVPVPLQGQAA